MGRRDRRPGDRGPHRRRPRDAGAAPRPLRGPPGRRGRAVVAHRPCAVPRPDPLQRRADRRVGRRDRGRLPAALVPVRPVDVVARAHGHGGHRRSRRPALPPHRARRAALPRARAVVDVWHRLPTQRLRDRRQHAGVRRRPRPPAARGAVGGGLPRRRRHPGPAHVSGRAAAAPDARAGARDGDLPWFRARGLRRGSRVGVDRCEPPRAGVGLRALARAHRAQLQLRDAVARPLRHDGAAAADPRPQAADHPRGAARGAGRRARGPFAGDRLPASRTSSTAG